TICDQPPLASRPHSSCAHESQPVTRDRHGTAVAARVALRSAFANPRAARRRSLDCAPAAGLACARAATAQARAAGRSTRAASGTLAHGSGTSAQTHAMPSKPSTGAKRHVLVAASHVSTVQRSPSSQAGPAGTQAIGSVVDVDVPVTTVLLGDVAVV